ncbi:MAG: transcriptional coactivator p15/PC4 family protein [Nanoarchaeota archaeon]|nr:transcriptional coactivator p15/PC4 family protein [Nanoarchaeota archaeon]
MEKDIGKINKGEYQGTVTDIVVGIKEYNGRVGVDIREFTTGERYTGPTKKGLRIPAESFSKFKELINSISEDDLKSDPSAEQPADTENDSAKNTEAENEDIPDY